MTLKEFALNDKNHFVAMEYYNLILNRTFLILLTDDYLIGVKVNGIVSADAAVDEISRQVIKSLVVKGDLNDPRSYIKAKYICNVENEDIFGESLLLKNRTNFRIERQNITNVYYDPRKKWGMGNYPHDGKVYIETANRRKRTFIILGNQSGEKIANAILFKN